MKAIVCKPPGENVSTEPAIAPRFPLSGAGLVLASELTLEVRPNRSSDPSISKLKTSTLLDLQ